MQAMRIRPFAALVLCVLAPCAPALAQQQAAFQFGLVGDAPYTKIQEKEFLNVVASLNRAELAFVVHIGDIQADPRIYNRAPDTTTMPCIEETYRMTRDVFQTIRHPFILTPGDNEWSDCHKVKQSSSGAPLNELSTP